MLKSYANYYYYKLPENKRIVYKAFYDAIKDKRPYVDLPVNKDQISLKDIFEIMRYVYNDTPSFFYLDVMSCEYIRTFSGYRYGLDYVYTPEEIETYENLLKKGVERFVQNRIRSGMTDFEKEVVIHDYLVRNVEYDYEALEEPLKHSQDPYNVIGPLLKSKAVCWGYACAFKLLCDYSGLKCIVVTGDACSSKENGPHAWNIIKLDGKPYHVDTTWDVREKGAVTVCYDYLNLDDGIMKLDHRWDTSVYPPCRDKDYNYYYHHRLFVSNVPELRQKITEEYLKGKTTIALKYTRDLPSDPELLETVRQALAVAGWFGGFYYVFNQKSHGIYVELVK